MIHGKCLEIWYILFYLTLHYLVLWPDPSLKAQVYYSGKPMTSRFCSFVLPYFGPNEELFCMFLFLAQEYFCSECGLALAFTYRGSEGERDVRHAVDAIIECTSVLFLLQSFLAW